ncbi:hypothetical protein AWM68_13960 [Fictibacillus phosphorivorans]|uniref:DUF2584 family protein n=2 Tax=Fictibacillus phosphorivorans TaxID=1221500 RepID=A0A165N174_9BACL|nr:hypothetical protein AWM68_13960 [Fictibacillus phosphorivorans]
MQMPMTMQSSLVTIGKEKRLEGNVFEISLEGYKLFILDHPVPVQKKENSSPVGKAVIKEVTWKEDSTRLVYELIDLHGVN